MRQQGTDLIQISVWTKICKYCISDIENLKWPCMQAVCSSKHLKQDISFERDLDTYPRNSTCQKWNAVVCFSSC